MQGISFLQVCNYFFFRLRNWFLTNLISKPKMWHLKATLRSFSFLFFSHRLIVIISLWLISMLQILLLQLIDYISFPYEIMLENHFAIHNNESEPDLYRNINYPTMRTSRWSIQEAFYANDQRKLWQLSINDFLIHYNGKF